MAVPFSRSTRALNADSFRYTLISLGIASLLLIAWCVWFFSASIKFTESSEELWPGEGVLVASFPKDKVAHITRGQPAQFFPGGGVAGHRNGLPAVVVEVEHELHDEAKARVSFVLIADHDRAGAVPDDLNGRIEVEIERLSPAQLVLRGSGLSSDTTVANKR